MQHEWRGGIYPQAPCWRLPAHLHLLFGAFHGIKYFARLHQEGLALLGQFQTPRGAAQQGDIELFFQPTQRTADTGSRLGQLFGSGTDRAAVHHANKGQQFIKGRFHSCILVKYSRLKTLPLLTKIS